MKPKFKLYCTLFIIAVITSISISIMTAGKEAAQAFKQGWDEQGDSTEMPASRWPIEMRMESMELAPVFDQNNNTQLERNTDICFVEQQGHTTGSTICYILSNLLYGIGFILFWRYFIRLILKLRKGNVFAQDISSTLFRCGIMLIMIYVGEWLLDISRYIDAANVSIEGLTPVFNYFHNNMLLMTGAGLLLLSQIILMGKEIKEEQELTI